MNEEDKKIQKHLVDEMMKVSKTNPDVMLYMQALMEKYEQIEKENQKLKSNQVKTFNKIKDHINGCNCEISEGHYSNDNHSNYWKTFKEILEDIKNNLKKYDNNDYVYIPAWREKELLKIEEENQKLNKIIDNAIDYIYINSFDKEGPTKLWFRVFKRDLHGHAQKLLDILKKEVE